MTPAAPEEAGAFREDGPWRVDPERLAWARGLVELRAASRACVAPLVRPRRLPPVGRFLEAGSRIGAAVGGWALRERRAGGERVGQRPLAPPAARLRAPRPLLHQARPRSSPRGGACSRRAGRGVQALPRPGAARALRGRAPRRGGGSRPAARRRCSAASTRRPSRRPRSRRCTSPRLASGEEVVVKVQRPRVRERVRARHRGDGVDRAVSRRPDSGGGARQPAGARRAVRRDHRRGARLPARGREHARHRARAARGGPARRARAAAASGARHPPRAGDGAPVGLLDGRRRGHARGRHRHRRGDPLALRRLPRGRDDLRRVPRRPARREPRGDARGPRGALRLRHHRPPRRAASASRSCA